jgi:amphi-Trp domain-containing protein
MSRSDDYERELTADRETVASVLHDVADGVRDGTVRIDDGTDAVTVDIPDELVLELELETEDGQTSLELELEWPASDAADADGSSEADEDGDAGAGTDEQAGVDDETRAAEAEPAFVGAPDAPQSLARFEVYRDAAGEWRWRLRHRNGNVIATGGEGYTRKHNALKGLRSVMANSSEATITDEFGE